VNARLVGRKDATEISGRRVEALEVEFGSRASFVHGRIEVSKDEVNFN